MKKRMLSLLLAITMVMQLCSTMAYAEDVLDGDMGVEDSIFGVVDSGTTADGLSWTLYDDGILYIKGTGSMPDYAYDEETGRYNTPWHNLAWQIDHVVIGDGITSIGSGIFGGMTGLEKLTIGASVEAIAEKVFYKTWDLGEIVVSADNTHYRMQDGILFTTDGTELVFYPCNLESASYTIPDGVQKIGPYAFSCASSELTEVTIPEGVTTIGTSAFDNLQLEMLDLPESLKTIGSFAFYGGVFTEVTIPANVEFIGTAAFGYTWLEAVTFEGDAPAMDCGPEEQIFEDVEATVYYPANNATWTEENRLQYGGELTWVPVGDTEPEPPMAGSCGDDLTWSLEDGVLTISGSGAMYDYQNTDAPWNAEDIQAVVFDEDCTITWIGMAAFAGCTGLTAIDIPDTVTTIATEAFRGCTNLASVSLPEELTIIGGMAFYGCTALTEITVPAKVISISNAAFASSGLESITMLGSEPNLGMFVFQGCDLTTYANWPSWSSDQWGTVVPIGGAAPEAPADPTWSFADGVLTISGSGAMPDYAEDEAPWSVHANETTKLIIEDGITAIGTYAFVDFDALRLAEMAATVQKVGDNAFCRQSGAVATRILFVGEAPEISQTAFTGRYNTVGVYMEGTESWEALMEPCDHYYADINWLSMDENGIIEEGVCSDNDLPWTVDLEGTLTISGSGPLGWMTWTYAPYEKVVIEEGITSIGEYAFCMTSMTSVTIPASVTSIGDRAFDENLKLEEITFLGNAPAIGESAFAYAGFYSAATVHYPDNGTWTEENRLQYGGVLNWVPYEVETAPDTTAPVLSITGPENGSRVWGSAVLEVSATDEDENVTITVDGAVGETVLTAQQRGEQYTFYLTGLAAEEDGKTLTITVTAQDSAGNTAAETLSYIIDNVPNPVTGLTAESREDGVYLSWISADPEDNVLGYEICRETDGVSEKLGTFSFGIQTYKDTDVQNGETYTYTVSAFGANLSPVSTAVTLTYTWDETPPTITEVWPATSDKVTFCHDGTLQMAATDDTALDYAEFYVGDARIGSADFNAQGTASLHWDCSALSGKVTLTYVAYDKVGNAAETTAEVTVRPYTRPVTPADLTAESGFRNGVLTWTYDGDLQTLKQFNIYDGDPDGGMLITSVRGYQYAIRDLEEPVSYKVAAVDIYGNQSFSTAPVTVTPILTENVPPKAVLAAQELTAVTGTPITLSGSNSTDNDTIASYTWDLGDGTTAEGIHATHTYTAGGTYTVVLTVTDRSGNSDTVRAEITVLDTLSEDATHTKLTVTVRNSYAAGTPGIAGATVTVFSDGYEGAALTDSRGTATLVVPKGQHTLTVVKNGFDGKMQEISIGTNADGETALTIHLAPSGVDIVGGDLKVEPMTREEIEEAGIDTSDPANNHVVKQSTTVRFQPTPELAFELPIEQILNAAGKLLDGKGFGWHTFTPDPPKPDDPDEPEEDDDDDKIIVGMQDPIPPKYDVGVFPVGDSAFMVIYGQTHWLKEMFNVELIVFNNSYVDDLEEVSARLQLPEGLSLAAMLEGDQTERVDLGTIERKGTAEDTSVRQVNWYVRGDAEGEYNLTALVSGNVGGEPFEKTFTAEEAIKVYAGSALKLTVTLPKSAYAEKEYAVKFSLTNVSDKPIYNLSFGLDSAQQFVAERMSDGSTGEVEREFTNEDFKNNMTYGLPTLEPGKAFNLILRTTFAYEHQFIEWAMGKIPGTEVGYRVSDIFVTTLEGSTTEIPVEIVLEDVKKDSLFQWVWDETIGALKDNAKDAIIEFVDDKVFQGIPVVEKGVEIIEVVTNVKDELTDPEIEYKPTVNVTDGVQCVPKNEVDDWLSAFDTYSLRRSALPGVILWTDADDAVISEDGKTMTLPSGGRLYVLRLGETAVEPEIDITTYYVDIDGTVQPFTQKLTAEESYTGGLGTAKHILLDDLTESTFEIPTGEEIVEVGFDGWLIGENGEILRRASNEKWTVEGEDTTGLTAMDGKLMVDSTAYAGTYTIRLALEGTEEVFEQTITLTRKTDPEADKPLSIRQAEISEGTVTVHFGGRLPEGEGAMVYAAAYDAGGRMTGIGAAMLTDRTLTIALPEAETAGEIAIFALDGEEVPLLPVCRK